MPRPAQFLFYVHFQVRFGYQIQRNSHLPVGSIFKNYLVAVQSHSQQAGEFDVLGVRHRALPLIRREGAIVTRLIKDR